MKVKKLNIFYLFFGIIYSLILLQVSAGLSILLPNNTSWLSVGDGIMELSWEFFRRQPFFQLPFGLNPKYGLEISSTMAFDGQIPIMSILFRPFSIFLPERFQYVGIFLFITFVLNYCFSAKIFSFLGFNKVQSLISATILSMSPVILNRYIENTHYPLTSAWIIFWIILICLNNKEKYIQWYLIFNLIVLIHFYYIIFALIIYIIFFVLNLYYGNFKLRNFIFNSIFIITSVLLNMYLIGFFHPGVNSEDLGFGEFRTTLSSLFDSSGWSIFIPDIPEPKGAYEGFAYLGISSIAQILFLLFLYHKKNLREEKFNLNFKILFFSAFILYFYSLSNKIAFGNIELFQFYMPDFLSKFVNTFRSSGRFAWLLVFLINIWSLYKIFLKISKRSFYYLLFLILTISIIEISNQIDSFKKIKFSANYNSNLVNLGWNEIEQCYLNLRIFPPFPSVENGYNFSLKANDNRIGINTGRLGRFNQYSLSSSFKNMQSQMQNGVLSTDSFYVFTQSQFVNKDLTNFYKNLATFTLDENSGWGVMDGYTFIAPNLKKCHGALNIKNEIRSYGPIKKKIYNGGILKFGLNKNSDKYILSSFSKLYSWGVLTQDYSSIITINFAQDFKPKKLVIKASNFTKVEEKVNYSFEFNSKITEKCTFTSQIDSCIINLSNFNFENRILNISIKPMKELNGVIPQLGLSSIEFL